MDVPLAIVASSLCSRAGGLVAALERENHSAGARCDTIWQASADRPVKQRGQRNRPDTDAGCQPWPSARTTTTRSRIPAVREGSLRCPPRPALIALALTH